MPRTSNETDAPASRPGPADPRPLLVAVAVGLVLGALLGLLVGATRPASARAQTVLALQPIQPLASVAVGPSSDQDATTFVQGELIVLGGQDLKRDVQQALGLDAPPDLTVSQVGGTYAVAVSARAGSADDALTVVRAVADTYTAQRKARLEGEVSSALTSVGLQIESVQTALAAPALQPAANGTTNSQVQGLQTELGRLLALNSSLTLSRGQLDRAVTVLQAPAAQSAGTLSPTTRDALLGALLGALVAVGLLTLLRRGTERVRSAGDLDDVGVPLLLPVLDPGAAGPGAARLLAARLVAARPGAPLLVAGVTGGVPTRAATLALAAQLVERGPVLVLELSDLLVDERATDVPGLLDLQGRARDPEELLALGRTVRPGVTVLGRGTGHGGPDALRRLLAGGLLATASETGMTVVAVAPALDTSSSLLDLARTTGPVTLLAARGQTTRSEVLAALDVLRAQSVDVTGLVLVQSGRRARSVPASLPSSPAVARDSAGPAAARVATAESRE